MATAITTVQPTVYKENLDTATGELKQSYFNAAVSTSLRGIKIGEKEENIRVHDGDKKILTLEPHSGSDPFTWIFVNKCT